MSPGFCSMNAPLKSGAADAWNASFTAWRGTRHHFAPPLYLPECWLCLFHSTLKVQFTCYMSRWWLLLAPRHCQRFVLLADCLVSPVTNYWVWELFIPTPTMVRLRDCFDQKRMKRERYCQLSTPSALPRGSENSNKRPAASPEFLWTRETSLHLHVLKWLICWGPANSPRCFSARSAMLAQEF